MVTGTESEQGMRRTAVMKALWRNGLPPIVGLVGKKRSGKDTFAQRLVDEHGFVRIAFADALRDCALYLDPIVGTEDDAGREPLRLSRLVDRDGWEAAKDCGEVRRTLQNFGIGIRRLDPEFWIGTALSRLPEHDGRPVVITDVRFRNEAQAIKEQPHRMGWLVRITRPGMDRSDTHVSEVEQDSIAVDAEICNDQNVEQLHQHADRVVEWIAPSRRYV